MWALHSNKVLLDGIIKEAFIGIQGEKIVSILESAPLGIEIVDVGDSLIMAGLVDSHVHINEPGRTEWEGFFTATQAAAAGGITTVVDMPLNCTPVTTNVSALQEKLAALGTQLHVDVGFWGGVVPGNTIHLRELIENGALGCKAFMIHSGIDDFPESNRAVLREAMRELVKVDAPLLLHAELDCGAEIDCNDPTEYLSYLQSRPQKWEVQAIEQAIGLSKETGCHVHIVHLSAADALPIIEKAKQEGVRITVETCPHYLCLCAEEISSAQTQFKCAPPIRENENRQRLWEGLRNGVIDFIVSDHSPCTPNLKKFDTGNFHDAWGGISSLQLGLPSIWTEAKSRGFTLFDLVRWLSTAPSKFVGLSHRKGKISIGMDADFVIWDPNSSFKLQPEDLRFRHKLSPYLGKVLQGRVLQTYLRGQLVYDDGIFPNSPVGQPLFYRSLNEVNQTAK
jgi:allantoinase